MSISECRCEFDYISTRMARRLAAAEEVCRMVELCMALDTKGDSNTWLEANEQLAAAMEAWRKTR